MTVQINPKHFRNVKNPSEITEIRNLCSIPAYFVSGVVSTIRCISYISPNNKTNPSKTAPNNHLELLLTKSKKRHIMRSKIIASTLSLIVFAFAFTTSSAQFEGEIKFEKTVGNIHVKYKYMVSGNNVRIEEIGDEGKVDGIQLMDLDKKMMYALSPERKIYMDSPNRRPASDFKVKVERTGNEKEILGKKCEEIIVINEVQDRKIVYWITKGDYTFFVPMLQTLNRKENQALYFLKIPKMENCFPLHSIEYRLSTGEIISELKATSVTVKKIDSNAFVVPSDYTKFEK